jgi:hypothetical protein
MEYCHLLTLPFNVLATMVVTPIAGTHMPPCFQPSAIAQWEKRRGKPATLSEKTTCCGSVRRVWCEKHAHFRKNLLTMSVQFGIAFII